MFQAAKLDPYNSDIFLYLGHFYATVQKENVYVFNLRVELTPFSLLMASFYVNWQW